MLSSKAVSLNGSIVKFALRIHFCSELEGAPKLLGIFNQSPFQSIQQTLTGLKCCRTNRAFDSHHIQPLSLISLGSSQPYKMVVDFDATSGQVISPSKLAHVVLRTGNLKQMVDYYSTFLGGHVIYENDMLAFISYDEEHHRIAILGVPGTQPKAKTTCGLEHIAFTFDTLSTLLLSYRQRKVQGIEPLWPVNHGPTTSIYYRDPDGNMIETQVDNFDNPDDATAFMKSKHFRDNPIGTDFDPDDWIRQIAGGKPEADLKIREEIGSRELPDFF